MIYSESKYNSQRNVIPSLSTIYHILLEHLICMYLLNVSTYSLRALYASIGVSISGMDGFVLPNTTGKATIPMSQSVFFSVVENRKLGMSRERIISEIPQMKVSEAIQSFDGIMRGKKRLTDLHLRELETTGSNRLRSINILEDRYERTCMPSLLLGKLT